MAIRPFLGLSVLSLLISCSNPPKVSVEDNLKSSVDSLEKAIGFDSRENVLEWKLDTIENNVLVEIKSSDESLAKLMIDVVEDNKLDYKLIMLPEGELKNTPYGIVNQSVANMRVRQSRAGGMATQVLMGMKLKMLEKDGQWHKVITPQGYVAWIPDPSFEYLTEEEAKAYDEAHKLMVTATTTFAYEKAEAKKVVSDLVYGNVVELVEKGKKWTEIKLPGNRKAFVKSDEVQDLDLWQKEAAFNKEELVDYAFTFNGQPYLWGGNSYKGIDCSGFSGAVYYKMGLLLPRDADQQRTQGDKVEYKVGSVEGFKNLEVGDLLFFGSETKITHVAVWIGNNEYIHSSGKVHVTSVDPQAENYKQYLMDILVDVRRINGSQNLSKTINLKEQSIW